MDLFIYSDESGVFDKANNSFFVFAGIICIGKEDKDNLSRLYSKAEKDVRSRGKNNSKDEIKASSISNYEKGKLFRSLNHVFKFSVVITQAKVKDQIFFEKKSKQRYLDYAYKIAVKKAIIDLSNRKIIDLNEINNIRFFVDEHTTATNGRYELREGLECEFKFGTFNYNYNTYYKPIIPGLNTIDVQFCNSSLTLLVRAADIVANRVYYLTVSNQEKKISKIQNLFVINLP